MRSFGHNAPHFALLLLLTLVIASPCAVAGETSIVLDPIPVGVEPGPQGRAVFECDEAQWLSQAGEPNIPWQVMTVLLPPRATVKTVSVRLQGAVYEPLDGQWSVEPARPPAYWDDGHEVVAWPSDRPIVDGRDISIYAEEGFWPAAEARLLGAGRLRKWRLVDVALPLVRYDPVAGSLERLAGGTLVVSYEAAGADLPRGARRREFADRRGEARVRRKVVNFDEQRAAYEAAAASAADEAGLVPSGEAAAAATGEETPVPSAGGPGYVIITTSAVQSASTKLADFVAHKEAFGFTVQVITETDFGGGTGDPAAENIRAWLQAHYVSDDIEYVLLIGDPRTTTGPVPMKMLWPRHGEAEDEEAPSDYYYADLTGNWDKDGDGYYGEWGDDFGAGGVDRHPEVLVGRIPYYGSISDLDAILQKTIDYGVEHGPAADWRYNVLLPMKPSDEDTPGYHLGERIKDDFIVPEGWSYHRIYDENYGLVPPPETTPCTVANVTSVWSNGTFGLIEWWTHGWSQGATAVMDTAHVPQLNDDYPGLTFQASCHNSSPETTNNLTYALLKNGCVCTIGATRVSWYIKRQTYFNNSATNSGMAYEYAERIIPQDMSSGEALHDLKEDLTPGSNSLWMNFCVFNIYGDPATFINPRLVYIYINGSTGDDDWDGLAPEWDGEHGPKATIQAGVDVAPTGAIVLVAAGTYSGTNNRSINFHGKAITLCSEDGPWSTIIECGGSYLGFRFENAETSASIVEGFTIQNGYANWGGGIYCSNTSPQIKSCVITGCYANFYGGGIHATGGSNPTIENCIIAGNTANSLGGALYLYNSSATVTNTTIVDNTANGANGSGIYCRSSDPTLTNCILWGNQPTEFYLEVSSDPVLYYCDIAGGWTGAGSGNIDLDPLLLSDRHIPGWSPCRDAGTTSGAPSEDVDGEARPVGGGVDIGADELVDTDGDGLGDWSETHTFGTDPANADTDNDGAFDGWEVQYSFDPLDGSDGFGNADSDDLLNYEEAALGSDPHGGGSPAVLYVDDDNTSGPWDGTPEHPYETIQDAVDAATPPTLVHVRAGTYLEHVTMRSGVGPYGSGPHLTTINSQNASEAVSADGMTNGLLVGFTIISGADHFALRSIDSMLTVRDCVTTASKSGFGGALSGSLRLVSCIADGNDRAGAWDSGTADLWIDNCTLVGNTLYGVGHWGTGAVVARNSIVWNNGDDVAGSLADYSVTYCDIADGDFAGTNGNISADPLFVTGLYHGYYLSQTAAGQGADSPCVDAGSDTAANLGFDYLTTRTDSGADAGTVDMGYHAQCQVVITSISRVGDDVTIEWNAAPGTSYVVEWSADRVIWNPVSVGETGSWTDVGGAVNPRRFYRVRPD